MKKTSPMLSTILVVSVILAFWFLPFGYSLKCYSYLCSNSSAGPSTTCAPPQEFTCPSNPGDPMAPDRCITQRFMMEMSSPSVGVVTMHQEIRNCSNSIQCTAMRGVFCNAANSTGTLKKCEVGCCEGDLCNSGGPIPTQAPGPTGPSGADLSCFSCSNVPEQGDQTSCSNPIVQTCGAGPSPFLRQDRCMTAKVVGNVPGVNKPMEYQMKNCSNVVMCNQEMLCTGLNASAGGAIESCQVSCCFGNLCNADGAMITTTAATTAAATTTAAAATAIPPVSSATTGAILTGLTCFSALITYFYLM